MNKEILEKLTPVAKKYLKDNPVTSASYLLTSKNGFLRNENYRYLLFPQEKIGEVEKGKFVYLKGFLKRDEKGKTPFYFNPKCPVQFYLNGQLAYKSDLLEEAQPKASRKVSLSTEKWNEIIICLEKTKTGMGLEFGSGSVKGDPFFVWQDEEELFEGWQVSEIYHEKLLPENFAQLEFSKDFISEEKITLKENEKLFAKGMFSLNEDSEVSFSGLRPSTKIYLSSSLSSVTKVGLSKGNHEFVLEINEEKEQVENLKIQTSTQNIYVKSAFNFSYPWAFLGPVKEDISINDLFSKEKIIGESFWQIGENFIRPYLTSKLFGRWNYPLGVTLNGLFNYSMYTKDEEIFSYVKAHLTLCSKYYEYSLWDKKIFGAPTINFCLSMIDSLDDCGSMGYTLLRVNEVSFIPESDKIIQDIAHYILHVQARTSDGTLFREASHSLLMENTLWADDIYMSIPFLVEYYKQTKQNAILWDILRQFKNYFSLLHREDKNLLAHVYDFPYHTHTDVSWGRGNAWYFLSLGLALESLKDTVIYEELLSIFKILAPGFTKVQGQDYFWHQVLDDETSYAETSCTAIMLFTFAKSNLLNWEKEKSLSNEVIEQSFYQLQQMMVDENYNLLGVCRGSGFSFTEDYYKNRLLPRINDTHGIGIYLTCGVTILQGETADE